MDFHKSIITEGFAYSCAKLQTRNTVYDEGRKFLYYFQ